MGSEIIPLLLIPIVANIFLLMMFGNADNSPLLGDIQLISDLVTGATSRDGCISIYPQCSNDGCNNILQFPCGDLFYILLIIGTIIGVPFLSIVIPALIMFPVVSIKFAGVVYTVIDFWWYYAMTIGMFGLGVSRMMW